ncbi:hypothetical protein T265_13177, partial [Opisthorchis viverrini]
MRWTKRIRRCNTTSTEAKQTQFPLISFATFPGFDRRFAGTVPTVRSFQRLSGACYVFLRTTDKAITAANISSEVVFQQLDAIEDNFLHSLQTYFERLAIPVLEHISDWGNLGKDTQSSPEVEEFLMCIRRYRETLIGAKENAEDKMVLATNEEIALIDKLKSPSELQTSHKENFLQGSSTAQDRFRPSQGYSDRHSPRVSTNLMFFLKPSWIDCKYTYCRINSVSTGNLSEILVYDILQLNSLHKGSLVFQPVRYFIYHMNSSESLERLVLLVRKWGNEIEQLLNQCDQVRRETDDMGPSLELAYWRTRFVRFT